jgi:hypothetical protein
VDAKCVPSGATVNTRPAQCVMQVPCELPRQAFSPAQLKCAAVRADDLCRKPTYGYAAKSQLCSILVGTNVLDDSVRRLGKL